jgi:GT2 family glycosyltransferase
MRPAKIALIVSTYENPAALEQVLRGLSRQSVAPAEALIADDGSRSPTRELIDLWRSKFSWPLRHVWQPDDGFRKTMILNKAIAASISDYIVLLDGDCVPHPKFVEDHAALAEESFWVQGRRCFVQESYVPTFSGDKISVVPWLLSGKISGAMKAIRFPVPLIRRDCQQRGIIGCNMGVWRNDLMAINGFDEDYAGWGLEDSDLGTRLYHLGRPRKFVYGRAIVFHLNHPSLPRDQESAARARLEATIASRRIRCDKGLSQYLVAPEVPSQ